MSRPVLSAYRWHASHGLSDTHDNDQEEACDDVRLMAVRPTTMMSEVFSAYAWAWKNRLVPPR